MKFLAVLLGALPFFAAAQTLPPAAPNPAGTAADSSSAGWEIRLDYEARTSYLGREYGSHDYCLNPQVSYSLSGNRTSTPGALRRGIRYVCEVGEQLAAVLLSCLQTGCKQRIRR